MPPLRSPMKMAFSPCSRPLQFAIILNWLVAVYYVCDILFVGKGVSKYLTAAAAKGMTPHAYLLQTNLVNCIISQMFSMFFALTYANNNYCRGFLWLLILQQVCGEVFTRVFSVTQLSEDMINQSSIVRCVLMLPMLFALCVTRSSSRRDGRYYEI